MALNFHNFGNRLEINPPRDFNHVLELVWAMITIVQL